MHPKIFFSTVCIITPQQNKLCSIVGQSNNKQFVLGFCSSIMVVQICVTVCSFHIGPEKIQGFSRVSEIQEISINIRDYIL